MMSFISLSSFPINGKQCYGVLNPERCNNFDHLIGQSVLIDQKPHTIIGVERFAHAPPYIAGEKIALQTDFPARCEHRPPFIMAEDDGTVAIDGRALDALDACLAKGGEIMPPMTALTSQNGLTIRQLRQWLDGIPDYGEDAAERTVWIKTGHATSSPAIRVGPLNKTDSSCDILFTTSDYA